MPHRDPREVIEIAALKHRAAETRSSAAAGADEASKRDLRERALAEDQRDRSLCGGKVANVATVISIGVGLLAPMGVYALVSSRITGSVVEVLGIVGFTVLALVSAFVAPSLVQAWTKAWNLRRLTKIGHGFDVDRYLEQLSCKRSDGRLVVELCFKRPWDSELRNATAEAVLEWVPGLSVSSWRATEAGETLHIESTELVLTEHYSGGNHSAGSSSYTNYPAHGCLLRIASEVVPRLDAANPVTRFDVEIMGKVCPIDWEPGGWGHA